MASVARREEKGSDVDVAAHLLLPFSVRRLTQAIIVSNDSDLKLPIEISRQHVPVGLVNPTKGYPAGAINAAPPVGVGGHWWHKLAANDFTQNQLPRSVGNLTCPPDQGDSRVIELPGVTAPVVERQSSRVELERFCFAINLMCTSAASGYQMKGC